MKKSYNPDTALAADAAKSRAKDGKLLLMSYISD